MVTLLVTIVSNNYCFYTVFDPMSSLKVKKKLSTHAMITTKC